MLRLVIIMSVAMNLACLAVAGPLGRIEIDKPFPEIKLPRLADGKLTSMAEYRGRKVLLHVFASW